MNWNRLLSALVAAGYLAFGIITHNPKAIGAIVLLLIIALACIWFSDEVGASVGNLGRNPIITPTPGLIVAIGGWIFLLLPLMVGIIIYGTK